MLPANFPKFLSRSQGCVHIVGSHCAARESCSLGELDYPARTALGHPRPSCLHADDGRFALSCGSPVAAQRIGEECHKRKSAAGLFPPECRDDTLGGNSSVETRAPVMISSALLRVACWQQWHAVTGILGLCSCSPQKRQQVHAPSPRFFCLHVGDAVGNAHSDQQNTDRSLPSLRPPTYSHCCG